MSVTIIHGSALALPLPDNSVDLVVTSPPYFGLRSYTDDGNPMTHQVGAEATPAEYIDALIAATRECVRVLKNSGSLWVNLGDKYVGGGGFAPNAPSSQGKQRPRSGNPPVARRSITSTPFQTDVRPKSLLGLPWRYALRCIDELGLILRAEVVWSKPNALPEAVRDRVRRSHEQWFHFTLRPNYYANVDEVREPHAADATARRGQYLDNDRGTATSVQAIRHDGGQNGVMGFKVNPLGKLPGSVWTIATQPLRVPAELGVDHFAAFPMEFPRRIITGWSPPGVCTVCGEGRRATSATTLGNDRGGSKRQREWGSPLGDNVPLGTLGRERVVNLTGYACACPTPDAPTRPAVVLDPFGGTGTTALVADVLGRDGITVDLSADYCRLAQWRTGDSKERARVLKARAPMRHTAAAAVGNPPERNVTMPSKMSDKRLLTSYTRAKAERSRIDGRVAKATKTLDELEATRTAAQETLDTADRDRAEADSLLEHLRSIARNRNVDLDTEPSEASDVQPEPGPDTDDEEPPVQVDGDSVAQPAPGTPAFSQGY